MFYIDSLKNLVLYKNKDVIFNDKTNKERRLNSVVFLCSNEEQETLDLLNSRLCKSNKNISGYYVPYKLEIDVNGSKKRFQISQKDRYKNVKSSRIKRLPRNLSEMRKYNFYYDLQPFNSTFFSNVKATNLGKVESYCTTLNGILKSDDLSSYNKKYMVIPFNMKKNINGVFNLQTQFNSIIELLYMLVHKQPEKLEIFKDVTFVVYEQENNLMVKFNPSELNKKSINLLMKHMKIMNKLLRKEQLDEEEMSVVATAITSVEDADVEKTLTDHVMESLKKSFMLPTDVVQSMTGEQQEITDKMEEMVETVASAKPDKKASEIISELESSQEFLELAEDLKNEQITAAKSNKNNKRNDLLREEQKKIKINRQGKTLDQILNEIQEKKIENRELPVQLLNTTVATSNLVDFEYNYNKKQMEKDTIMVLQSLSSEDREIPMYIRDIKREDSSDAYTKKETLTMTLEDERRIRHTIKIDIPKFVDDKYLFINGNKKVINKQLSLLPVVKTAPDSVQVVSSYNKSFLIRQGQKLAPKIERVKKFLIQVDSKHVNVINGDNTMPNMDVLTSLEYDDLGKNLHHVEIGKDIILSFNQPSLREELKANGVDVTTFKPNELPIGYKGKNILILDLEKNVIRGEEKDICDFMVDEILKLEPSKQQLLEEVSVGKRYQYTIASVLNTKIPLVMLLAYKDGLSTVLRKGNVNHEFTDKRKNQSLEEKNNKGVIVFSDGYLYYDKYPLKNSLLLNAMNEIPTKEYKYSDFDSKEVYLELFYELYGSRTIGKGYDNFTELFIDPITLEVLKDLDLPTDFTELFLYANSLLEDNSFMTENNMNLYRVRSNEIVNVYLYRVLSDAYSSYKNASNAGSQMKMSVPQDKLMKELNSSVLVEDYSTLSPILEMEKMNNVTYKGPQGINLAEAFTLDKRAYHDSMLGVMGISSPNNAMVGVTRFLSYNANILSTRGYLKTGSTPNVDELNAGQLMTAAELLTACSANHDAPERTAMTVVQSKHTTPVKKSDKLLIGTGVQKTIPYVISDDFAFKAKQDGVVELVDNDAGIMILKYKDGSKDAVDISQKLGKNGQGGFFIPNTMKTTLKKGSKFKKSDILAKNESYIQGEGNEAEFMVGTLAKVAIYSGLMAHVKSL